MNKNAKIIISGLILLVVAITLSFFSNEGEKTALSFDECAKLYPVMESYPRQCRVPNGELFRENIGNELEKDDLIRVSSPRPNSSVESPLEISGVARGSWFFEASFPIIIEDAEGKEMGRGIAKAGKDWMTESFVPFSAKVEFVGSSSKSGKGSLILKKDNPSGLPEKDDSLIIPIFFK